MMKEWIFSVFAGLLLFAGCKEKGNAPDSEESTSGEPSVAELQEMLDKELNKSP